MNAFVELPFSWRLALLAVVGLGVGSLANGIAAGYSPRRRPGHPWFQPGLEGRWLRLIPVIGWLLPHGDCPDFRSRENGTVPFRGSWQPLVVELLSGAALAVLYWWEVGSLGLVPAGLRGALPADWIATAHWQYIAHALLFALMLAASLIDLDEKIIPDSITLPGTLLGLVLAAVAPMSLLPDVFVVNGQLEAGFITLASPFGWPQALDGRQGEALALALACWFAWGFALLPRSWYTRHGLRRAVGLCVARICRHSFSCLVAVVVLAGGVAICAAWIIGGPNWRGLLTALVGMAAGGGMIWAVRLAGFLALRREAMGFGDVTLMAMIGSLVGWQACVLIFFLAPLFGLVVGIAQWISRRDNEIPYGPFLCLATLLVIVRWASLWEWLSVTLESLGHVALVMVLACAVLMFVLLRIMRLFREHFAA